jgi:hypothetical protein
MRRTLATLALVLAAVLPAVAVASWWGYGQATDTARFTATAKPLATDRTVQDAVVDELVTSVPSVARSQVRLLAEQATTTAAYRSSWRAIQRTTHARLAARLTGDVDEPLTLDLARAATVLRSRATAAGLGPVAQAIPDPRPVVIADREQVRRAHDAASTVHTIRAFSLPLAILALIGVLLTAPGLASGFLRLAGCLAVSTILLVAGWIVARGVLNGQDPGGDIAAAVFDVLARPLRGWAIGGAVATVVLGVVGGALSAAHPAARRA